MRFFAPMSGCYAVFHKQLGDLVLLEPALTRLREHHGAPVRLLTRSGHAPLVSLMPGVRQVRGLPLKPLGHLYCFDTLSKSATRSLFAPALRKLLLPAERREMSWFHPVIFPRVESPELGDSYIAEFFWSHTPVPAAGAFRPPVLNPPPEAWKPRVPIPDRYILFNPAAGWQRKSWTAGGWVQVLKALDAPVLMTGGGSDWQCAHCGEIAAGAAGAVTNIAGGTTLPEYLWLCANARAILTVDGVATHLAAAFGVPSLTLFGPTSSRNWHRASGQQISLQAPAGKDGICRMRNLDPSRVVAAALALARD